eukprot:m.307337 g.307337  ORF g.307337 m.307337 type:complete len:231 (+) comp42161_c0_seq1:52-744(+)
MATSYGGSTSKGNISAILSGGHILSTIQKPQVITRLITLVCCIIVFGCIADKGSAGSICYIDSKSGTCAFGVFVGVVGFILCLAYLVIDFLFELSNNVLVRKFVVLSDIIASALWGVMFFVCFCVLAAKWTSYKGSNKSLDSSISNSVQAAIALAFFCIIGFVVLAVLAVLRFRQGPGELGDTSDIVATGTTGTTTTATSDPTLTTIRQTGDESGSGQEVTVDVHASGAE